VAKLFFEYDSAGFFIPTTHKNSDYSLLYLKNLYIVTRISPKYYSVIHDLMQRRDINQ